MTQQLNFTHNFNLTKIIVITIYVLQACYSTQVDQLCLDYALNCNKAQQQSSNLAKICHKYFGG